MITDEQMDAIAIEAIGKGNSEAWALITERLVQHGVRKRGALQPEIWTRRRKELDRRRGSSFSAQKPETDVQSAAPAKKKLNISIV